MSRTVADDPLRSPLELELELELDPIIKTARKFIPPTLQEVQQYLTDKNISNISANHFLNHYEASGWMRGKTKIKDWKACIRTWKSNTNQNGHQNGTHKNTRGQRVNAELDRLAREDCEQNGFTDNLDTGDI